MAVVATVGRGDRVEAMPTASRDAATPTRRADADEVRDPSLRQQRYPLDGDEAGQVLESFHAVLLRRMKPDARGGIYQTKVSTIPLYRSEATLTLSGSARRRTPVSGSRSDREVRVRAVAGAAWAIGELNGLYGTRKTHGCHVTISLAGSECCALPRRRTIDKSSVRAD